MLWLLLTPCSIWTIIMIFGHAWRQPDWSISVNTDRTARNFSTDIHAPHRILIKKIRSKSKQKQRTTAFSLMKPWTLDPTIISQTLPWKSSMGPCSGWGGTWSCWVRVCSDIIGPTTSPCSPLRRDSSSSSSRILLFSLTQLGQKEVEGCWFSSSFSSTFRLGTLKLLSDRLNPDPSTGTLHSLGRDDWDLDLLESSREASRTSLKIRSIFFLLAGGWPSDSSLGCLLGQSFPWRADCRQGDLKSFWMLGRTAGFPVSGTKQFS